MTRRSILAIAVAVIVVGGVAAGVLLLRHNAPHSGQPTAVAAHAGGGVPTGAESTVRLLLSARGRQALTPELNAALPHGGERLFPAGSTFTPNATGWHQAGAYANLTGTLREPGKAPAKAEIGFVNRHGRWLITFEGTQ
jgi:hypothetical protein